MKTRRRKGAGQRDDLRMLLSSTRFIASIFWLTIIVAATLFVLPYSQRSGSPVFYGFLALSVLVFLGHRYFPYDGYHPLAYFLLMAATNALVAVMVYLTGGSESGISMLYAAVIIFSSAYFELLETLLVTAMTCAIYFAPIIYETVSSEALKNMAIAVPIYMIIALGGSFVISKAREEEREKQAFTHLYDQADSKRREVSTLYAVALKLASTLDEEEMIDILVDNACKLVRNDAVAVTLLDAEGRLGLRAGRGLGDEERRSLVRAGGGNPLYMSASAVLPVVLRDADEDPRFRDYLTGTGFGSMIAVPLYASASVIGVLCCLSASSDAFDDDAARLLLTLASEVALALEKASLYRRTLEDKAKIETIINSLSDGLAVLDAEGRLVLANPSMDRLIGLRPAGEGKHLLELTQRSGYALDFGELALEEALARVLEGESLKSEMVMPGDPQLVYKVLWTPLPGVEGSTAGAVILMHDVSDFVELDRMKSEFISVVSHELKTPLTSIKGFVRLMAAERVGPITDKQRHYLDVVLRQSESLTLLINDLLDISRIEAGIIEVRQEPLSLAEVVAAVVQQLDHLAQEKGIAIGVDIPRDLPPLSGDAERLGQVFTNLIHNAVKFTPPQGEVTVRAVTVGRECVVRVSDTGIGISPQDLPKIFDKFYQVDSSSTRHQSGSGLGLSISRRLVNAHGGELRASSARGEGTVFTVVLPLHPVRGISGEEEAGACSEPAGG